MIKLKMLENTCKYLDGIVDIVRLGDDLGMNNNRFMSCEKYRELFKYVGTDYEADMKKMAADPTTQKWWSLVHPLQQPLPGETDWADMKEVYHLA